MIFNNRERLFEIISKECNDTKVIYDENGVVIIKVDSYKDCHRLFFDSSVNWCIANDKSHWDGYVNHPEREQYFIIDFNKIYNDSVQICDKNSLIGVTLNNGELYAAHDRLDNNLLSSSEKTYYGYHPLEKILKENHTYKFAIKKKFGSTKRKPIDWGAVFLYFITFIVLFGIPFLISILVNKR